MIVKGNDIKTSKMEHDDGEVEVKEYGGVNGGMDIAVSKLSGNYSGEGKWSKNTGVEAMIYFVLTGKGVIRFENGEEVELEKEDCVFINKNRGYKVEVSDGEVLEVLMASNPAWSLEQYEVYS
jgi:mannose-6-phosphate isomerase-like protein (cupin superfamily)